MKKRNLLSTSSPLLSRWMYVLIANNESGKTSFQRHLVHYLCGVLHKKLDAGARNVTHERAPRNFAVLYCSNRSYQETRRRTGAIENYIASIGPEPDVAVISTHANQWDMPDVAEIWRQGRRQGFNVAAVFFDNALSATTADISELDWQERLLIRNPVVRTGDGQQDQIQAQLRDAAIRFGDLLIVRASTC